MQNLAGNEKATTIVTEELTIANIPIVPNDKIGEVPSIVMGKVGPFTIRRAWYYYMVDGPVPLHVAEELYSTELGKKDVRSGGDCGCRPPKTWAKHTKNGLKALLPEEIRKFNEFFPGKTMAEMGFVAVDSYDECESIVDCYHIDSLLGLILFMETVRKYNLTGEKKKYLVLLKGDDTNIIEVELTLRELELLKRIAKTSEENINNGWLYAPTMEIEVSE